MDINWIQTGPEWMWLNTKKAWWGGRMKSSKASIDTFIRKQGLVGLDLSWSWVNDSKQSLSRAWLGLFICVNDEDWKQTCLPVGSMNAKGLTGNTAWFIKIEIKHGVNESI